MNLPTPSFPTDNLYKFVAITGLVFVVLAIVLPIQLQNQVDREFLTVSQKFDHLMDAIKVTRDESANQRRGLLAPSTTSEAPATVVAMRAEYDELLAAYQVNFAGARRTAWVAVLAGIMGVVLMIAGFRKWYLKVQKFQDQILEADAARAMREEREAAAKAAGGQVDRTPPL